MFDEVMPGVFIDPALRDGDVRLVRPYADDIIHWQMTRDTWLALMMTPGMSQIRDRMGHLPEATYRLPRGIFEVDAAEDVRNALAIAEPGGEGCTMPGCLQPVVSEERGFPLCQRHAELMAGWDSLVA